MLGAVVLSMSALNPIIDEMGNRYGVDPMLIKAVIKKESNWDVNASRFEAHKSDASWGLMQVMLATARKILNNPSLTTSQLINPRVNIEAGVRVLAENIKRWKNLPDAIAAYNAGSPRLDLSGKYVNQSYVNDVLNNYEMYKKFGTTAGNIAINVENIATSKEAIPIYILLGIGVIGLLVSKN